LEALVVTWQAGGGAQVALGLGRALAERGHRVRFLAPAELRDRVTAAGCVPVGYPAELEFDPAQGRRMEEQRPFLDRLFFGRHLPDALLAELEERPADVVVVDYLLRSAVAATELQPVPLALLIHTIYGFHGVTAGEEAQAACVRAGQPFTGRARPPAVAAGRGLGDRDARAACGGRAGDAAA
jgi:hypothetical protein